MATAEQLKFLIQSHFERDDTRFTTLALQVAAHEAQAGHQQLALEIRRLIDRARSDKAKVIPFRADLGDLVIVESDLPDRLADLVVSSGMNERIGRVLRSSGSRTG